MVGLSSSNGVLCVLVFGWVDEPVEKGIGSVDNVRSRAPGRRMALRGFE